MKLTVRKKATGEAIPVAIQTEFIKLESALKLSGAVSTGGAAKNLILEGEASVNGEVCTMRGKKLYPGDSFTFMEQEYRIVAHEA